MKTILFTIFFVSFILILGYKLRTKNETKDSSFTLKSETMKNYQFLKLMYASDYFPDHLVDEVKNVLLNICLKIEAENTPIESRQLQIIQEAINEINELQNDFLKNDSDIETGAREAILEDIENIIKNYNLTCDFDKATDHRNW